MDLRNSAYHNCIGKPETISDGRDEKTYQRKKEKLSSIGK